MRGTADGDLAKMAPVHLTLFTGQGLQSLEGLWLWTGTQAGYLVSEVIRTSRITPLPHHRIQATRGETWELLQGLVDKGQIAVNEGGAIRPLRLGHAGLGQYPVHSVVMHTQLPGNSPHPPLLHMVVTQNLCFQFFVDRQGNPSGSWPPTRIRGLAPDPDGSDE